jgi:hypothetical protein
MYPFEKTVDDGAIFFTKNGRHLKTIDIPRAYFNVEWYPVIGIDAYSPVEVNFGECPFMYSDVEIIPTALDEDEYFSPSLRNPLMHNLHEHISIKEGASTYFSIEKTRACEQWALQWELEFVQEEEFSGSDEEWADYDSFDDGSFIDERFLLGDEDFIYEDEEEDHADFDDDGADYYHE